MDWSPCVVPDTVERAAVVSDKSQPHIDEGERLRQAYWDAICECAQLEKTLQSVPAAPALRAQLEAAELRRIAARDALQKFMDRGA